MNHPFFHLMAQSASTDMSDFLQQISGLLALICVLSALWVGLMIYIIRRERERRRLKAEGLDVKPSHGLGVGGWLSGKPAQAPAAGRTALAVPTPDLDMLTGDLGDPDGEGVAEAPGESRDERAPEAPDVPPAAHRSAAANVPASSTAEDAVELLRVWRDRSDGALVVEIGGRRFRTLADLRSAELERRFRAVLDDLHALPEWVQPASAAEQVAAPPAMPAPPPPTPPRPRAPEPASLTSDEAISMRPGRMFRDMRRAAMGHAPEAVQAPRAASIPEQIEALLQQRLMETPAFAARSIHVMPSLEGGVRIEVDGVYCEGVGEVADDTVRALLIEVVRQWEESQ